MIANHAAPKEGKMSKVLANFSTPPDALAIVQIEQLRPMLAPMMMMAPIPPQLADVKKLPDLLTSIGAKVNFTGDMSMSLSLKANDAAAAEQVEKILDQLMEVAKQQAAMESARMASSSDPVEQAMAKYQKRMSDKVSQVLRPVRKGETLTLAFDPSKNPQGTQIATVGILVALLMPAIFAARAAAQRAQMQNQMKQMAPPMPVQ
jgi:cysteinyl-tRNA synthetase